MECVNLRQPEEGVLEESINFEEVQEADLISFIFNGRRFCYDPLTLLRYLTAQRQARPRAPLTVPERFPLSEEQIQQLYTTVRELYPQVFLVVEGNQATPYTFTTLVAATEFVSRRQQGVVYQLAQLDDQALAEMIYPNGLEGLLPVFALRGGFESDELPNGRPQMWGRNEPPVRNEVFERAAPPVRVQEEPQPPRVYRIQTPQGLLRVRRSVNGDFTCHNEAYDLVACPANIVELVNRRQRF